VELPTTISEIDQLIADGVQENLHLDYKASNAIDHGKTHEITKDVSAFANSDGGIIIYGIEEKDNLPVKVDGGVDHIKFKREWLEQLVQNHISPRIDDVRIVPIPVSAGKSVYVIGIPKSYRGPHQAKDKKYYKRFNFNSEPMEDYEINDVRTRRRNVPPLVSFDVEIKDRTLVLFVIKNIGQVPALDVSFKFFQELTWHNKEKPPSLFTRGIQYFPPNRTFFSFTTRP
jgi:predicted HTH transcriptional regulator